MKTVNGATRHNGQKGADYTQARRLMGVRTPLGEDALLLTGFTGEEGISRPFHYRLDALAENRQEVSFDKLLGQPAAIRLALGSGQDRYFHGVIRGVSQGRRDQTFTHYRLHVVPAFWLLTLRFQSRIFQHQGVPDILKKVLEGLDVTFQLQGTYHSCDFRVQYRETDFAFASRLMEDEGIYYFFEHGPSDHRMVVADTPQSHTDVPGQSRFVHDEVEGGLRDDFRVTRWEKAQELCSGRYTLWDHNFELPHQHLDAQARVAPSVPVGQATHPLQVGGNDGLEVYDYPGGYGHRFDGIDRSGGERPVHLTKVFEENRRVARLRAQEGAAAALTIQGAGNCRHFTSGHRFTLECHFNADGPYVLTWVEHTASLSGNYRSGEEVQLAYRNRFTCIPLALPYRPPRVTPRPRVEGTQTAVVVGPPGEEVFCDKYGRVKVQFHWDRQGQRDENSSCWVRVGTPWAGKRRGLIHIPLVGDEVIVGFLEGNPDRPIILGSVYNAETMPPHELPAANEISGYKGRTGSNFVVQDDRKGKELYKINAHKDLHVFVGNTSTMKVKSYHRLDAHDIFLNAEEKIHLTVGGNFIRIEKGGIFIHANRIYHGADETILSEAGTTHTVKGALVKVNC